MLMKIMNNDGRISNLLKRCDTFGDRAILEDLVARFEKFAEVETIAALEKHYMPKIEKFSRYIDDLEKQMEEMREIIK